MLLFIFCTLIAMLVATVVVACLDLYGGEMAITYVIFGILGFCIAFMNAENAENTENSETPKEQIKAQWIIEKKAQGCKVTSFIGTSSRPRTVWTCQDGEAFLQPE